MKHPGEGASTTFLLAKLTESYLWLYPSRVPFLLLCACSFFSHSFSDHSCYSTFSPRMSHATLCSHILSIFVPLSNQPFWIFPSQICYSTPHVTLYLEAQNLSCQNYTQMKIFLVDYIYCHKCSLSLWSVARGSKHMFLELIHGLFIT